MDDRSTYRHGDYGHERNQAVLTGYWDFLKYHLLFFLLPAAAAIGLLLLTQRDNVIKLFSLFALTLQFMAGAGDEAAQTEWIDGLFALLQLLAFSALAGLAVRLLSAGLFFLPGLALRGRMNAGTILKTGLRHFFATFFVTLLLGFALGLVNSVLSAIPVINVVAVLLALYAQSMFSIYYDYWFSYNEASGQPIYSGPKERFGVLYGKEGTFWLYALLLSASYLVLLSAFAKPYIQLKIAQRMGMTIK